MEFSVYGCNAGYYNDVDLMLYGSNFEYNWQFQCYFKDAELLNELNNRGIYNREYKVILLDREDIYNFYADNYINADENICELMDNIEMIKDMAFESEDYWYLIVDIY